MRITDFIRTSVLVLTVFTVSICQAADFSESIEIPDSQWRVDTQCSTVSKATQCAISVSDGTQEEKVLDYPAAPVSASYEAGVFLLTFGCGTACSATYAYKLGGSLGGPFPLVEVADSEREVLMSLGDRSVRFYRMFEANDKPLYEVTPEFGGYSLLESIADTGIEDHVFRVTYQGKVDLEMLEYEAPPLP
ncbi:hypothetical protein V0R48_07090 [Pseudomonas alcaligenes]|uniref:hypothetical protein n=1 Tax=Aquipseudomonas alcaligenes TaxID=43263 RepID=UPI002E7B29DF|nr:hypothetical protein [Pseudomonas alcaligenes]MEE1948731.1 hypothetical protein [Pseudomonas alcaligenes]